MRAHLEQEAADPNENWRVGGVHYTHLYTKNTVAGVPPVGPHPPLQ